MRHIFALTVIVVSAPGALVAQTTAGVLWRESFNGPRPMLTHWTGRAETDRKVPVHGVVTRDGRTAERLNVVYAAKGATYDYWRVASFKDMHLTEAMALRLTVKSTWPVVLRMSYRLEGAGWNGVLGGPSTKGTGAWETIELRGLLKLAREETARAVKVGRAAPGDEKRRILISIVVIDTLAAGKENDIYVDDVCLVDSSIYVPEADVESLPFRVAWARRVRRPPTIDGKLTAEDGWRAGPVLDTFTAVGSAVAVPRTEAHLLYDETALYVGMRLDGPSGTALKTSAKRRDGHIWSDDAVEIFLVPTGSTTLKSRPPGSRYFHLGVNAAGTRMDQIGDKGPTSWDARWTARASGRQGGWDVEIAIPFPSLGVDGPPKDVWTFNLCRTFSGARELRYASWSRLARWFHEPRRFGRVAFGEGRPDPAVLASMVVREELRTRLGAPRAGLERARAKLAGVPASSPGKRAAVGGLAVLTSRTDAMAARISGLSRDNVLPMRAKIARNVDVLLREVQAAELAAEIVALGAAMPRQWPFIVLGAPAITDRHFARDKPLPSSWRPARELSLFACRGEYEPVTFILYATRERKRVRVSATDLSCAAGRIGADALDIRIVKYWFQAQDPPGRNRAERAVFVPELLLKNDGLIVVDLAERKNYMRTGGRQVDISDPAIEFLVEGDPKPGIRPKLLNLAPKDTKEFQPFDVPAGHIKQILVTAHVPTDAAAGAYRGKVRVETPGSAPLVLPLTLTVPGFDLAPSPIEYSIYYRAHITEKPLIPAWSDRKTETQYRAEMANMLAHGVTSPTNYISGFAGFVRAMKIRRQVGMLGGSIFNVGTTFPRDSLDSDEALEAYKKRVRPFIEWAKAHGYTYYTHGLDENDPALPEERRFIQAVHEMGGKVFQAVNSDGGFFELAGDLLDQPNLAGPHDADMARRVRARGHRLGIYANPQVGFPWPETYRRNYGVALWQAGYGAAMDYAYQHSFGHIWNDFDSESHIDHVFAYPTVDGVIDTLAWEGFREAVDDVRYVATLLAAARKAAGAPARRAQAAAAEKWIRSADAQGDLDKLRREIIKRILSLTR